MARERTSLDRRLAGVIILALPLCMPAGARVLAEEIQFIISVSDAQGRPVTDLAREEIHVSENGVMQEVIRIRPIACRSSSPSPLTTDRSVATRSRTIAPGWRGS